MAVSNKLQEKRMEKRYTRPQLAELVGINWETIKAYEAKGATPSLNVAFKLAKVLETTVDELFTLEEQEKMEHIEQAE